MSGTDNLRPFVAGEKRAREASRKAADARAAKRLAQRGDIVTVRSHLATMVATHDRDELGPQAAAVAADTIGRVARGEIPLRNGSEAAEWVRVLVDIARLEAGEPTSAALVAHITADATAARLAELKRQAAGELPAELPVIPG